MTILSPRREALLDQLIALAGSADAVHEALRALNDELGRAPTTAELVKRILILNREPVASTSNA